MANQRPPFQFQYAYERDLGHIHARVSFGGGGAPTIVQAKGINSIERLSAGVYKIHLRGSFNSLMNMSHMPVLAVGAPASPLMQITAEDVSSLTDPSVTIKMTDSAGVATDPASGEVVLMHLITRQSS